MALQLLRILRGPNRWLEDTALEAIVDLGLVDGANLQRLRAKASDALDMGLTNGGELLFLRGDATTAETEVAYVVATLTATLQPRVGARRHEVQLHPTDGHRAWRLIVPYVEESVGKAALEAAVAWTEAVLLGQTPVDLDATRAKLASMDADVRLGPSTASIARAARERGIPVRRLTDGSLLQLGHGSRSRRVWAAETDHTSLIAEAIAQDKELTKSLLKRAFLPVPVGVVVRDSNTLWEQALRIGVPVVVKPQRGNQGRGVSVGLNSPDAIEAAYAAARAIAPEVLMEKHIAGHDYRLLVVGGRLVAAARREPPKVTGDGHSTVRELVARENRNPLRGEDHSTVLSKIPLDAIALRILRQQNVEPDSVVADGIDVVLRGNGNLSTGGTATDVTDEVHPDVARMAVEAAMVVALDIAGVDWVAPNVSEPPEVSGGAIVEINAAPGLRMHLEPSIGKRRPVGEAIVQALFPQRDARRVPIVAVTGTNGKTTTTRLVAHLLRQRRLRVGMTCTDGAFVDQRRTDSGDCSGPQSARAVLSHPHVDAAVLETARGGMLREGLGFDWCDVAIVTNIGAGDHLGLGGIATLEQLVALKSLPVRRVAPSGVAILNAGDVSTVGMAPQCRAEVLLFSHDPLCTALRTHREGGGFTATVREGQLVIERGTYCCRLGNVIEFPLTHGARVAFQIDNLLAAAAAGFWLGLTAEEIKAGLRSFTGDLGTAPGRFNVLQHDERTVVLDYGHNVSALHAVLPALRAFGARSHKVVYTAAGDRRDRDIVEQGFVLASFFDEVFTYEGQCRRGRAPGEVTQLLCAGIANATRNPKVTRCVSERGAIETALRELKAGELLLCQVDQVGPMLEFVTQWFTSERRHASEGRPVPGELRRS